MARAFLWAFLFLIVGLGLGAVVHYFSSARTCYEAGGCWDERAQECRDGRDPRSIRLCKRR